MVTVSAILSGVTGTTTLTCQSPTFTPQGTVNIGQSSSTVTIVQFTGANGSSPYTFSLSGGPGWLSLSNSGCAGIQVNCSLVGAMTGIAVGVYSFSVQATDNIGNTACTAPGCAIAVNVTASSAEDNIYCTSGEVVTGLSVDGPANPLTACNYTAIAGSSLGGSPTVINVCPQGQLTNGSPVVGCAANAAPGTCSVTGGVIYCNAIQSAINYAYNTLSSPCGTDIQLWPRIDDDDSTLANRTTMQNAYTEPTVVSPGNVNCGPDYTQVWWYIRTRKYASLPPPGNRVTPSWVNQPSIVGRPNYAQTTDFGIPVGIYLPMWRGEQQNAFCQAFSSQMNSATVGGVLNGLRIMGIMFTCPHGRNTSVDLYGNHICSNIAPSGTPIYQCSPGSVGAIVSVGCLIIFQNFCNITSPSQGKPAALPHGTGSQHVILDRDLFSGCDDITMLTCYDVQAELVYLQNGQHLSLIDSYLIHGFCMYAIGPCVEGHGVGGGNPQMSVNDIGTKVLNSYIEGSSENTFLGGATVPAGIFPTDWEVRRNHFFKPLTWKADDPSFVGKVQDVFVSHGGAGYSGGTTCSIDPPKNGTTALCTPVVVAGAIADVVITNKGSGYTLRDKRNGSTYPANPSVYFTDGGTTYTSCSNQLSGFLNVDPTNGNHVTWQHDNKFIAGLVGTFLTINNAIGVYTVSSYNSNVDLTITPAAPLTWQNVAYSSNLPVRGDCVHAMNGAANVKNLGEFKHGIRILWEGNIHENVWGGQSDQKGFCFLVTPKNPSNNSPTVTVQDIVFRYNFCRNTVAGMQISAVNATQCPVGQTCLPQSLARVSIHDNIFDGMTGPYWTAGTAPISAGGGECMNVETVQPIAYVTSYIKINHNTCIGSLPTGYSLTAGSALSLFYNLTTTPALMPGITFENNIAAGGAKNVSSHTQGAANCLNNACTDQIAGHGPTEVSLRQALVGDFDSPVSVGTYQKNQVTQIKITEGGTCTVLPTTVTLSAPGGGGHTSTAQFNTGAGTSHNAIIKLWPVNVGDGYTSAPSVSFNGTCSVPPAATAYIAGATNPSNSSACFDHNLMPLQAWNGVIPMTPYPVAQIDPLNNACDSTTGGHNNTNVAGTPVTVNTWADVKYVNFLLDANNAEKPTGDLHLQVSSPGHLGANDGLDIGANVDLVLGKSDGSAPSPYTGITINPATGVAALPQ